MLIAVYPGSFDPVTSGHMDIVQRAAALYESVVVLVGINSAKNPVFTADERAAMLTSAITAANLKNVTVACFSDALLVDYAEGLGARAIVKGLRAVSDFEYEFQMAQLNRHLKPSIETVFMMTSAEHSFLSSSIVREIARLQGDVSSLVPDAVLPAVRAKFDSSKSSGH